LEPQTQHSAQNALPVGRCILGFHFPIHQARPILALPACQCRLQTVLHKALADIGNGVQMTAERIGDCFICPVWAVGIPFQQDVGMSDFICWQLTSGNDLPQSFAFLLTQANNVALVHLNTSREEYPHQEV